jgi:hypothetical protein
MPAPSIAALVLLASAPLLPGAINQSCAARGDSTTYLHIHGRLARYNGGYPNLRLWQINTHHLFGIYGNPADLQCIREGTCEGSDYDTLPGNLARLMKGYEYVIYGDFEIRPLEPLKPGHMQAACIVSADHLVRQRSP